MVRRFTKSKCASRGIIVRDAHMIKKGEMIPKTKSLVVWVGRPDFSFKVVKYMKVRETYLVEWKITSVLLVDRQACRN